MAAADPRFAFDARDPLWAARGEDYADDADDAEDERVQEDAPPARRRADSEGEPRSGAVRRPRPPVAPPARERAAPRTSGVPSPRPRAQSGDDADDERSGAEGAVARRRRAARRVTDDEEEDDGAEAVRADTTAQRQQGDEENGERGDADEREDEEATKPKRKKKVIRKLSAEAAEAFAKSLRRRGVVYLSRIPPYMKPNKVRQILSDYGEVLRVYLVPEDETVTRRRKKFRGVNRKRYEEGWVEFASKKVAKMVAERLNGAPVGGSRRSYHYYDLWNIKYLKGFQWSDLAEEFVHKSATRQLRVKAEMAQAKREAKLYLQRVGQAKAFAAMDERRRLKRARQGEAEAGTAAAPPAAAESPAADGAAATKRRAPPPGAEDGETKRRRLEEAFHQRPEVDVLSRTSAAIMRLAAAKAPRRREASAASAARAEDADDA